MRNKEVCLLSVIIWTWLYETLWNVSSFELDALAYTSIHALCIIFRFVPLSSFRIQCPPNAKALAYSCLTKLSDQFRNSNTSLFLSQLGLIRILVLESQTMTSEPCERLLAPPKKSRWGPLISASI